VSLNQTRWVKSTLFWSIAQFFVSKSHFCVSEAHFCVSKAHFCGSKTDLIIWKSLSWVLKLHTVLIFQSKIRMCFKIMRSVSILHVPCQNHTWKCDLDTWKCEFNTHMRDVNIIICWLVETRKAIQKYCKIVKNNKIQRYSRWPPHTNFP
jgi:hypothetical protein